MDSTSYPEYKDSNVTWLEDIPAHWDVVPIKFSLATPITDGPHETPKLYHEGIPFLSAEAVKEDKLDFSRMRGYISEKEHARFSKKYKPARGDVYMVKSGATTGNVARVETDEEFNIWSPLAAIRPDINLLTTDFVFYFMKSSPFFYSVELSWSYGTQQNIGMNVIANLKMARPSVDEQKKIGRYLNYKTSQIDRLIEKKKTLIEKLNEQRIAFITQVVTKGLNPNAPMKDSEVGWLGGVPEHWEVKRLKFCVSLKNVKIEAKKTELLYMGLENVESQTGKLLYDFDNPTVSDGIGNYFKDGDVLFGKLRPYLAKSFVAKSEGFCSTEFLVLEPSNYLPEYLNLLCLSDGFIKLVDSSTYGSKMPRASWDFIGDIQVPVPPIVEQTQILDELDKKLKKLDSMVETTDKTIQKLNEYRTALISAAVTGKIDVREVNIPEGY